MSIYPEYTGGADAAPASVLALDWDETTSDYPLSFRELARRFERVIIVTVNDELTLDTVCQVLDLASDRAAISRLPESASSGVTSTRVSPLRGKVNRASTCELICRAC